MDFIEESHYVELLDGMKCFGQGQQNSPTGCHHMPQMVTIQLYP